ncbi:uncharacterized protein LOC123509376 [Portunus trituberculatus]|uniref:uncharacterized protein LOC123509376 n=1 Tax=Portunus trituberculatus TaxID=210409 RepID=UPI001E1CF638|nr:uncharacterized protein LOC123509376 [Portunus trituberculatus]
MTEFTEEFTHSHKACFQCNGYYGPNFCQPLCATCHVFLYPDDPSKQASVRPYHEKTDDGDSGNEEPREPSDYYQTQEQLPPEAAPQAFPQHGMDPKAFQEEASAMDHDEFEYMEVAVEAGVDGGLGGGSSGEGVSGVAIDISGGAGGGLNLLRVCGGVSGGAGSPGNGLLIGGRDGCRRGGAGREGAAGGSVRVAKARVATVRSVEGRALVQPALQEQITRLTSPRPIENLDPTLIHRMPPEVWMLVFNFLDDMTLWAVGQVCRRWSQLVQRYVSEEQWQHYTRRRWPLFSSLYSNVPWQSIYTKLTESAPCFMCLHKMSLLTQPLNNENSWRKNRLRNELRSLRSDPPEGIQACPLDELSVHWQASIRGPAGSPYEGGTFFLYIQIPHSYPLCPPIVCFITKIFHPNVSRHGDIGIDSIQHNWSLALTISKVLISIQSLLTDPYTKVCMEPEIGQLYESNKKQFEGVAKWWTWTYAMHDAIIPESTALVSRPLPACGSSLQIDNEEGNGISVNGTVGEAESKVPLFLS